MRAVTLCNGDRVDMQACKCPNWRHCLLCHDSSCALERGATTRRQEQSMSNMCIIHCSILRAARAALSFEMACADEPIATPSRLQGAPAFVVCFKVLDHSPWDQEGSLQSICLTVMCPAG